MASVLSTLEPVVTVGLGIGFLGESISLPNLLGSVLVLGAAAGLALARGQRAPTPALETQIASVRHCDRLA